MIKKLLEYLLIKNKIYYAYKLIKYLPKNYKDKQGNNLFHYCAQLQHESIFDLAVMNQANVNEINSSGYIPIQIFIKFSYVKSSIINNYVYNCNNRLLELFLKSDADTNYLINNNLEYVENNYKKIGIFNNLETPIELLISIFWRNWEDINVEKEKTDDYEQELSTILDNYYATFNLLVNYGANLNTIKNETEIDNNTASWNIENKHIVSLFFIKFIKGQLDLDVIKPILLSEKMDYALLDSTGNNAFHILLGRFSSRYEIMGYENMVSFLNEILNKKTFDKTVFNVLNHSNITPMECLKKDSIQLKRVIDSILLKNELDKKLINKTKRKINKI